MTRQSVRYSIAAACLLTTAQFAACKSDAGPINPVTAGSGAVTAGGMGVQIAGIGAPTAGVGVSGTGVVTAGTTGLGFAGVGAAGVGVAGAPVAVAGTGAAGSGAAGTGAASAVFTCAMADKTTPPAMLGTAAAAVIVVQTASMAGPCAFSSCHDTSAKKAKLILDGSAGKDLHALMVDKASCESAMLKLVDSRGGDAALANSWLWQKLTAPAVMDGTLTTEPTWGTPTNCGQMANQPFGVRMPFSGDATTLDAAKLATIGSWICAGAP